MAFPPPARRRPQNLTPSGEKVVYPYVFLSVAIDFPPGECVGNIILNLAALGLSASFVVRYLSVLVRTWVSLYCPSKDLTMLLAVAMEQVRYLEVQHRLTHQTGIKDGLPHWLNLAVLWIAEITVVRNSLMGAALLVPADLEFIPS